MCGITGTQLHAVLTHVLLISFISLLALVHNIDMSPACLWSLAVCICVTCRVSSHWSQKPKVPPTFDSRTIGTLNMIAEEHWKRWREAEIDEETAPAEEFVHGDAQETH